MLQSPSLNSLSAPVLVPGWKKANPCTGNGSWLSGELGESQELKSVPILYQPERMSMADWLSGAGFGIRPANSRKILRTICKVFIPLDFSLQNRRLMQKAGDRAGL
jgi:hypothetical protein